MPGRTWFRRGAPPRQSCGDAKAGPRGNHHRSRSGSQRNQSRHAVVHHSAIRYPAVGIRMKPLVAWARPPAFSYPTASRRAFCTTIGCAINRQKMRTDENHPMRLTDERRNAIVEEAARVFGPGAHLRLHPQMFAGIVPRRYPVAHSTTPPCRACSSIARGAAPRRCTTISMRRSPSRRIRRA